MTSPDELPPLVDAGNFLLSGGPANLATGTIQASGKTAGVLTIRTSSTTLSVLLAKSDLYDWARTITALADGISGTGLATGQSFNGAQRGPLDLGGS